GENEFERGKAALQRFNDEVTRGQGVLDVVGLSPELVDGLYELTVAEPIYSDLYASWVDMNALLKFLEDRRLSGSLMVTASARTAGGSGRADAGVQLGLQLPAGRLSTAGSARRVLGSDGGGGPEARGHGAGRFGLGPGGRRPAAGHRGTAGQPIAQGEGRAGC